MFKSLYPSVALEFNIAPNTQIGRINIWNPTKGRYVVPEEDEIEIDGKIEKFKPLPSKYLKVGTTYYLRRDNDDNGYIDIYADYKYTKFITRLYDNPINMSQEQFIPKYWELNERKIYNSENSFNVDHYMRAGEFIENLVSDNIIEFGKRWLSLGGFNEISIDMQEYYSKYYKSYASNGWYGFTHYYQDRQELVECPFIDAENKKAIPLFKISNEPERLFRLYRTMKDNEVRIYE